MTNIFGQFLGAETVGTFLDNVFCQLCTLEWTGFEKCPKLTPLLRTVLSSDWVVIRPLGMV